MHANVNSFCSQLMMSDFNVFLRPAKHYFVPDSILFCSRAGKMILDGEREMHERDEELNALHTLLQTEIHRVEKLHENVFVREQLDVDWELLQNEVLS